jgi:biofilm PGA synthesis lipoprotein PgaB
LRPRGRAIIIFFVFLFIFNICQPVVAAFASFHDVPQDYWADPYIRKLKQLGYAQGEADGSYAPESHITNAEFIAFVCRMTGMDDTRLDRGAHWAEPSVEYARFMGWFTPAEIPGAKYDEPISREIAAKILMLGLFKDEALQTFAGQPNIADLSEVSEGCRDYVAQAYSMGIITGYPDGSFRPKAKLTRAETAAIMCRALDLHKNDTEVAEAVMVPVLIYHHISDGQGDTSPQKFRRDMEALLRAGYSAVFLEDLHRFVNEGTKLPERPVVITLDDGYLSNYRHAWSVLKELGMKAEIAVIGWSVGLSSDGNGEDIIPHFSWQQALEMVKSGVVRINPHSFNMHEFSSNGPVSRLGVLKRPDESYGEYIAAFVEDVKKIDSMIRLKLGYSSNVFTYPYGESSPLTEKLLESLGYDITLGTQEGINEIISGDKNSLRLLKRINADGHKGDIVKLIESYYK